MTRPSRTVLVLSDLILAYIAYILAFIVRTEVALPGFRGTIPAYVFAILQHGWLLVGLSQVLTIYLLGLYDPPERPGASRLAESLLFACALNTLTLTSYYFFRLEFQFPRSILALYGLLDWIALLTWRMVLHRLTRLHRTRVAVCGHGQLVNELLDDIQKSPWLGYDVVGVIADHGEPQRLPSAPSLGTREKLGEIIRAHRIDQVILVTDPKWTDSTVRTLKEAEAQGTRVLLAPTLYEMILSERASHRIKDIPLIPVSTHGSPAASNSLKRLFDLALAGAMLIATAPLTALCALLVRLSSNGPIIYKQARVGLHGRTFVLYKFRTMIEEAEAETGPVFVGVEDPRVTPIGRVLRRLRLDELPQLFNIIKNDMSFVGPRPERPDFVESFSRDIPYYEERLRVRPGLTGLAQINGYYHTTAENKLKYDLAYVYRHTLFQDLLILFETLKVVLTRKGV